MRSLFRKIRKARFSYKPLVEVSILKENLLHNLSVFQSLNKNVSIAPVLKSNAYGHGLVEVASVYDSQSSIPFFVVDTYYEALVLRNEDIKKPILVIGDTIANNIARTAMQNISFTLSSIAQMKEFAETLKRPTSVHVKVDTGMGRQGIPISIIEEAINYLEAHKDVFVVEGFCSHLSDADGAEESYTKKQIGTWNKLAGRWKEAFPETKYFHLSNTAGQYFEQGMKVNVSRPGIGLYGFEVQPRWHYGLRPTLEMRTRVSQVKQIKKGDKVGYNTTFEAPHDMTIALVPVGYNEGVPHRLSNRGFLLVKGIECPIIGRVSMNISTIDVSRVPDTKRGDEVIVISSDSNAKNSATNMAKLAETIPYVIVTHIPESLRRKVI